MDLGIAGRVALVTGSSRGIGLATAQRLCAEGAKVVLCARGADQLAEAEAACREQAPEATVVSVVADVTDAADRERLVATAAEVGPLEILVNNAGTAQWRDLDEIPLEDWRAAYELNVIAPLELIRATAPAMAERGFGRIVNVASTAGKRPSAAMAEYSVAKAAQLSLSRLFADRYAKSNVLVNAVCPGPTASELWMESGGLLDQSRALAGHRDRDEALAAAGQKRPIGRLAEVEEIADVIALLCSERASYVAGAAWSVDGGTVQVII